MKKEIQHDPDKTDKSVPPDRCIECETHPRLRKHPDGTIYCPGCGLVYSDGLQPENRLGFSGIWSGPTRENEDRWNGANDNGERALENLMSR